jgi:hypothetical protein
MGAILSAGILPRPQNTALLSCLISDEVEGGYFIKPREDFVINCRVPSNDINSKNKRPNEIFRMEKEWK